MLLTPGALSAPVQVNDMSAEDQENTGVVPCEHQRGLAELAARRSLCEQMIEDGEEKLHSRLRHAVGVFAPHLASARTALELQQRAVSHVFRLNPAILLQYQVPQRILLRVHGRLCGVVLETTQRESARTRRARRSRSRPMAMARRIFLLLYLSSAFAQPTPEAQKRVDDATENERMAVQLSPRSADAYRNLAEAYKQHRFLRAASEALKPRSISSA